MKICTKCREEKQKVNFRFRSNSKDGLNYWCKSCERVENLKRYVPKGKSTLPKDLRCLDKNVQHLAKVRMLKHRYNLTFEEYELMYKNQNNSCKICAIPKELGGRKGLHVDHCHITGRVRGLLCCSCNSAIGKLKENKNILNNAIAYLKL